MKLTKKSFWLSLFFIFTILLVLHVRYYADYRTSLLPGVFIKDGGSDLRARSWSVPVVSDWDGDGKKDLLIGRNYIDENKANHGRVSFYINTGSDASPLFNGSAFVQACAKQCAPLDAAAFG